jgi:hypothetical protein
MMSSTFNLCHCNLANLHFNLCLIIALPRQAHRISLSSIFLSFTCSLLALQIECQTLLWPFSDAFHLSEQLFNICLVDCSVQFTTLIACTAASPRLQDRGLTSRVSYSLDQHLEGRRSSRRRFADLLHYYLLLKIRFEAHSIHILQC